VRGALIVAQVSLSFVLLAAALLLLRSVRNSGRFALGFEPDGVIVATFDPQPLGYAEPRIISFYDELLRRLRALPGIERVALSEQVPMSGSGGVAVRPSGSSAADRALDVPVNRVSPDYFATIRQPLLRGRDFTSDDTKARRAIVNETLARRLWGDADPIGRRFVIGDKEDWEVIGVAKNALFASFTGDVGSFVFLPLNISNRSRLALNVRSSAPSAFVLADVRRVVRDIDANVAMLDPGTMRERMAFRLLPARIARSVLGIAGIIALVLASGGLYGLVSYTLAQRTKEIGIRVALGASGGGILRVVVGGAFRLTAIGVAVGMLLGAAATRVFTSLLYGLSPTDPLTFGSIGLLLLIVTATAGYTAARKALSLDPMLVLRNE
jgi:predicted permease